MTISIKQEPTNVKVKVSGSQVPADVAYKPVKRTVAHPHPYLRGNFYPVFEETIGDDGIECEVVGVIPESLRGSQYIRTGPNSVRIPEDTDVHHFFDGDGTEIEEANKMPIQARYMNRYVRTDVFRKTNKHGHIMFSLGLVMNSGQATFKILKEMIWMSIKGAIYGLTNIANGNTALTFINNRLLALNEAGTPFETKVPSLDTVGDYYFEDDGHKRRKVWVPNTEACTAHPKIDPKTGETIFFSWHIPKPFVKYSVISADGKRSVWEETIPGFTKPCMMHDFAITSTYSIMLKLPVFSDPVKNIKQKKAIVSFDESVPAYFGIIPRHFNCETDRVLWFEARGCMIFHTANAWDEKDADGNVVAVCMTACRAERLPTVLAPSQPTGADDEHKKAYVTPGNGDYEHQNPDATYLTLFRFDFKTMNTQITTLATMASEFPIINADWSTRPDLRYVYSSTVGAEKPGEAMKFDGIVKTDLKALISRQKELLDQGLLKNMGGDGQWELGAEELRKVELKSTKVYKFGGAYYGNEVSFVPNLPRAHGQELDEDDGHVLVYVYDESQLKDDLMVDSDNQVTELWIFDAKKLEQGPVTTIKIPRRIPYGFHGLHITRKQIATSKEYLAQRGIGA
ncbi:hypothetical protein BGZ54_007076 [Gamsiella multidivaricata]|nr:hypothetical protein BGZ54_007076 [Gamsiella multidivaricata]